MPLNICFDLPAELEEKLRREVHDLDADVKDVYVIELFRRGQLSHCELSKILGMDRFETDAWLKRHNIFEGSLTMADLESDRQTLERVIGIPP